MQGSRNGDHSIRDSDRSNAGHVTSKASCRRPPLRRLRADSHVLEWVLSSSSRESLAHDHSGYYLLTPLSMAVLSVRPTTEPVNNTRRAGESSLRASKPSQALGLLAIQVCEDASFDARAMRDGASKANRIRGEVGRADGWSLEGDRDFDRYVPVSYSLSPCFELALSAWLPTTRSGDHLINCGPGYRHRMFGVGSA